MALRDAGLLDALADAGIDVLDLGDVPGFRWRPDYRSPRAMNVAAVARVARDVADRVREARAGGRLPLVIGRGLHDRAGHRGWVRRRGSCPGVALLRPHPDLNMLETVRDGALDWMGVAHLLDVPGAAEELAAMRRSAAVDRAGRAAALRRLRRAVAAAGTRDRIDRLGLEVITEAQVAADPAGSAAEAVRRLAARTGRYLVHFDVDAIDFGDAPLSENTDRNVGLTLSAALAALSRAAAVPVAGGPDRHGTQPDACRRGARPARTVRQGTHRRAHRRAVAVADPLVSVSSNPTRPRRNRFHRRTGGGGLQRKPARSLLHGPVRWLSGRRAIACGTASTGVALRGGAGVGACADGSHRRCASAMGCGTRSASRRIPRCPGRPTGSNTPARRRTPTRRGRIAPTRIPTHMAGHDRAGPTRPREPGDRRRPEWDASVASIAGQLQATWTTDNLDAWYAVMRAAERRARDARPPARPAGRPRTPAPARSH